MSSIVDIKSGRVSIKAREVHEPLVEMLEMFLTKAKSGEIQGVAMAYMFADGDCTFSLSTRVSSFGLIGALEGAKHWLVSHDD